MNELLMCRIVAVPLMMFLLATGCGKQSGRAESNFNNEPTDPEPPGPEFPYGSWARPTDTIQNPAWPPEAGLVGQWIMHLKDERAETWIVQCRRVGKWEVLGHFHEGVNVVGEFAGTNVKVSGQTITFTQHFDKAPPPPWVNGATITAQLKGHTLPFIWWAGENSGSGTMQLIERQTPLVPARVPGPGR